MGSCRRGKSEVELNWMVILVIYGVAVAGTGCAGYHMSTDMSVEFGYHSTERYCSTVRGTGAWGDFRPSLFWPCLSEFLCPCGRLTLRMRGMI